MGFVGRIAAAMVAGGLTLIALAGSASAAPGDQMMRYVNSGAGSIHWATSQPSQVPSGFVPEGSLGYLVGPGTGRTAVYSCMDGGLGNYLSIDQSGSCLEGNPPGFHATTIGLEGYLYAIPPTDGTATVALYRCFQMSPFDHLETVVPPLNGRCGEAPGSYTFEGLLGYLANTAPAPAVPEAPWAVGLPVTGLAVLASGVVLRRRWIAA